METVEEQDLVRLVGQVASVPLGEQRLQATDDPGDCALRQVGPQQRRDRLADPTAVAAGQVDAQHGLVDATGPTGVARQDLAAKLLGRPVGLADSTARNADSLQTDLVVIELATSPFR